MSAETTPAISDTSAPLMDPSFAAAWQAIEPGTRSSRGVYSVYKTRESGLLISYRPDTLETSEPDLHAEIPPQLMELMLSASEGKLSLPALMRAFLRRNG